MLSLAKLQNERKLIAKMIQKKNHICAASINGAPLYSSSSTKPIYDTFTRTIPPAASSPIQQTINFTPLRYKRAKTLDEAKVYAKEKFGITNYDIDNLDIANMVNRGIARTFNKTNGKSIIPDKVAYVYRDSDALAFVEVGNQGLFINKKTFEKLDEVIDKRLSMKGTSSSPFVFPVENKYEHSLNRYKKLYEQGKLNLTAKLNFRNLYLHSDSLNNEVFDKHLNDITDLFFKTKKALIHNGKTYSYDEFMKLSEKQRDGILFDTYCDLAKDGKALIFKGNFKNKFTDAEGVVCHELGHLNDFNKMSPNQIDIRTTEQNFYKEIKNQFGEGKMPSSLRDFFGKREQDIANSVTPYSKKSIAEFIAEVFKYIVSGEKVNPEAMNLYKKYNGPVFSAFN